MQWLKTSLQLKGFKFEPFPEISFSSMNKMNENNLPFDKMS
jgi:hypothetical protein